ncbi:hypothetical protein CAPTEDRAFT_226189 [Capitella teleta]|uniref:Cryptochrome-1 n=1 Tax=Capitella teleta TaxID=283909 RepID=R7V1J3_CAPTE|nr:hypothetical protein CAPTEDRAFT_226189 [Capitella teleta]|eukprot:ELU12703.1 hypothetical protein CAPTEDRAFT_226189 [Capitella teleta]
MPSEGTRKSLRHRETLTGEKGDGDRDQVVVHWFRHGLRLHDNPSLMEGLRNCKELYPIFILDGEVAGTGTAGYNRMRFLHQCLEDLDKSFQKFGGRLYIFKGNPVDILAALFDEWQVTKLTFEQDPEPIWEDRDNKVKDLCMKRDVTYVERISHTLFHPDDVIEANGGNPPHTFSLMKQVLNMLGDPERPSSSPDLSLVSLPLSNDFDDRCALDTLKDFAGEYEMEEQEEPINKWIGGESRALDLLQGRLKLEENAFKGGFLQPNQYRPDLIGPPLTLSPHLRFGCLSVRYFYWAIHDIYSEVREELAPQSITSQLIWREYFYIMSVKNRNYAQMENNPICLQIPWYRDDNQLERWEMGKTGYPWIDACMNQLRREGWIHHVGRHAVSCFLTRGDLWIHWEDGLKVFLKYLLDADWSVCAGNWMWVSSSAFENCLQCPQCFSPIMYGMRMDPTGEYVRRYVPELRQVPLKYLFHPWKAPKEVQEKAGCIVGTDYPAPMVDHNTASKDCKDRMQAVKALYKDPLSILHCAPSNMQEVRQFCWLPDTMATGKMCTADLLCEGIEGM